MTKDEVIALLKTMKVHIYRADGLLEDLDMDKESEDFDLEAVNNTIDTIIKHIDKNYRNDVND